MTEERLNGLRALAKKVWPLLGEHHLPEEQDGDPLGIRYRDGILEIKNDFEEDEGGIRIVHSTRALDAAEAALLVLLGPPSPHTDVTPARLIELEAQAEGSIADQYKVRWESVDVYVSSYGGSMGSGTRAIALSPRELQHLLTLARRGKHLGPLQHQEGLAEAQEELRVAWDNLQAANGKLDLLERDVKNLLPKEETRIRLMTLCQDQGELTMGERVDHIVEAYDSLRLRARVPRPPRDVGSMIIDLKKWFPDDGAEGETVHKLIKVYEVLTTELTEKSDEVIVRGGELWRRANHIEEQEREIASLKLELSNFKEDLDGLNKVLEEQPDTIRQLLVQNATTTAALEEAQKYAAAQMKRADEAEERIATLKKIVEQKPSFSLADAMVMYKALKRQEARDRNDSRNPAYSYDLSQRVLREADEYAEQADKLKRLYADLAVCGEGNASPGDSTEVGAE